MKITKDSQFGDYQVKHKKEDKYQLECVRCKNSKWFSRDKVLENPICKCQTTKKKSKEVAVVNDKPSAKSLTKLDNQELSSLFGEQNAKILDLLQTGDTDKATIHFQRQMLSTLIDMIPIAESKYRETGHERAAYAMNSLISQSRELIADIQASGNQQDLINNLLMKVIQPHISMLFQNSVDNYYYLKRMLESNIKPGMQQEVNSIIDNSAKEFAHYLENVYNSMRSAIQEQLKV